MTDMEGLRHAAEIGLQAGRHGSRQREGCRHPRLIKPDQMPASRRGTKDAKCRGGVPALVVMHEIYRAGQADQRFQAGGIGHHHLHAISAAFFCERK